MAMQAMLALHKGPLGKGFGRTHVGRMLWILWWWAVSSGNVRARGATGHLAGTGGG